MSEEVQETETATELPPQEERDFVVAEDLETKTEERPEWLPEKYKTGEDLAKAYKELVDKEETILAWNVNTPETEKTLKKIIVSLMILVVALVVLFIKIIFQVCINLSWA